MNRPRLRLGLEKSRAVLNLDVCARLGRELGAARHSRALELGDVARRLLLSPTQVKGLEAADADAFYSAELYLVAARKYDALLGLASPLLDDVLAGPGSGTEGPEAAPAGPSPEVVARRWKSLRLLVAGSMVLAVSTMAGWWLVSRGSPVSETAARDDVRSPAPTLSHLVSATLPVTPIDVRLTPPAARPAAGRSAPDAGDEVGYITVKRTTWVFVRYEDNSTVERVLTPGERFVLRGMPIYLAAGTAPGSEVVLVGQPVDTDRFNVNGELRIGSAFLSAAARH